MAKQLEETIKQDDRFEIFAPRTVSLVCFRVKGDDEKNKQLMEKINATGKTYIVNSVVKGKFFLRIAICGTLTEKRHVDQIWELIKSNV